MRDKSDDEPPNSRVFVLHNKDTTKDRLEEIFSKFGNIEDVWLVKDRITGESKGVTYIKFSKMSEAARAMEEMNGASLPGQGRPLKVIIANSRNQGSKRDENEMERFLRIFIVIPRDGSSTEDQLKSYFSQFGEIDYVFILRDRDTNDSKGFAYVKFYKVSDCARALEECDRKYKAVLARPKEKRSEPSAYPPKEHGPPSGRSRSRGRDVTPRDFVEMYDGYSGRGFIKMSALVSSQLSEEQACALFDLVPGLCNAFVTNDMISYRTQRMVLEYASPQCAEYAYEKLNGFEYPIGEPIMLKPEAPSRGGGGSGSSGGPPASLLGKRRFSGGYGPPDSDVKLKDKLAHLTQALAEATSIIKSAGLNAGFAGSIQEHCSAKLPPLQPVLKNADGSHRLFIVCQPEAPPLAALKDVFCRFSNMVDCYLLPNRNCGYVCFASQDSAMDAMHAMHEAELYGNRLKVIEADPPRDGVKRPRYN